MSSKLASGFALFALVAGFGCTGTPGLEPPWRDDDDDAVRAPTTSPPSFGNANPVTPVTNGPNSPAMGAAGTGSVPGTAPPASNDSGNAPEPAQPSGMAGAPAEPPPQQGPTDPMTSAPDGGTAAPVGGFNGLDLKPECSAERAVALTADGLCSFQLPDELEIGTELTEVALVSNGQFSVVERVDGPLGCELLDGGFYFDMSESPARVTLCAQSCLRLGATAEMQVVLVLGCEPPAP